jgi:hypothetical protein
MIYPRKDVCIEANTFELAGLNNGNMKDNQPNSIWRKEKSFDC